MKRLLEWICTAPVAHCIPGIPAPRSASCFLLDFTTSVKIVVKPGKQTLPYHGPRIGKQAMLTMLTMLATIMVDVIRERLAILNRYRRTLEVVAEAVATLGDYLSGVVLLRLCWSPG
jgi:hypothetical protein